MWFLSFLKNVTPFLLLVLFIYFFIYLFFRLLINVVFFSYHRFWLTVQVKEIYSNLNFVSQRKRSKSTDHLHSYSKILVTGS